ncbi:MAG TPA: tetratricopeptide repeat protein [Rhizomicrobium sp.]|nr:tetratricopeptide repeat protein [Rhizomicrobium sp.]
MRNTIAILTATFAVTLLAAGPASADHRDEHYARCNNKDNKFTLQQQVAGCTMIIDYEVRDVWTQLAAINNRGGAYQALHDYPHALEDYNKVLNSFPDQVPTLVNRGEVYLMLRKYPEAMADFNRALGDKPGYSWALRGRAIYDMAQHRYADARQDIEAAIVSKPSAGESYAVRCRLRVQMGESVDAAMPDCDKAIALEPSDAATFASRAVVRLRAKDFAGAIADSTTAISLDTNDWDAYYLRGLAKQHGGDAAGAAADIAAAQARDPAITGEFADDDGRL